jgi:hypothetical protein
VSEPDGERSRLASEERQVPRQENRNESHERPAPEVEPPALRPRLTEVDPNRLDDHHPFNPHAGSSIRWQRRDSAAWEPAATADALLIATQQSKVTQTFFPDVAAAEMERAGIGGGVLGSAPAFSSFSDQCCLDESFWQESVKNDIWENTGKPVWCNVEASPELFGGWKTTSRATSTSKKIRSQA